MTEKPIIQVNRITKIYKTGDVAVPALRGISLSVNKGDYLIITGRNGSGKSTLLRQLGPLDHPTSGEIFLNSQEVTHMSEKQRLYLRLRYLGYIFQEYALIQDLTAIENVMLPAMMLEKSSTCHAHAKELLAKVGLTKRLHNLPHQLSGGEQQKVAIARALINNPEVIFADEPTANLDTKAAADVMSIFQRLNQEEHHTIMMITHEQEETTYGNRIITLSDGRIL